MRRLSKWLAEGFTALWVSHRSWVAVLLVLGSVPAEGQQRAVTPARKYLVLGADPQARNRQPITGKEEVVIIDTDLCDPGWGTGSGKKVAGCYPVGSAVLRDKITGFVTAMYVCGNEPGSQHRVTGKVVPPEVVTLTLPGPRPTESVLNVHHTFDPIKVEVLGTVSTTPAQQNTLSMEEYAKWRGGGSRKWPWVVGILAGVAAGAVVQHNWPRKGKPEGGLPVVISLPKTP
ncbi:MAG: hypothetical protein Q8O46_04210 [bacterium]|nr:hypothetical protein [bacterium]